LRQERVRRRAVRGVCVERQRAAVGGREKVHVSGPPSKAVYDRAIQNARRYERCLSSKSGLF